MRWIIESALQLRVIVLTIAAAMIAYGAYQLREMRADALPEFEPVEIEIQTEALGLSAAEVEDLVTLNLEDILAGTSWVQSIYSLSLPSLSSIRMVFEPGTDLMRARQLVQERLTLAYMMPNVAKAPVMLQPLSATSRAMMIGLSSKAVSLIDMSVLAQWTMRPKLMGVPGVANVAIWGERRRQLQVLVDPERLRNAGIGLDEIVRATGDSMWVSPLTFLNASFPGVGGWIDGPNQRLEIRHVLPISSPTELAEVSVAGTRQHLGSVADVVEAHPPLIGDAIVDNGPGLILVVEKLPDANVLDVVTGVTAALEQLSLGLPGIKIDSTIYRASDFVEQSLDHLGAAVLVGFALAVVVIVVLLGWQVALIAALAILASAAAAGVVLHLRGATINVMIFAGLVAALTAIIDDAVAGARSLALRLRQLRRSEGDTLSNAVADAAVAISGPFLFAALIMALALAPLMFVVGPAGALLKPLAWSYLLAILASMVAAVTVTPTLAALILSGASEDRGEPPVLRWLQDASDATIARIVSAPRKTILAGGVAIIAALIISSALVLPLLDRSLLPAFQERSILVSVRAATGVSHPEMYRIVSRIGRELGTVPGVANVGAHIGRAVTGDQHVDVDSAELWVKMDPAADYAATHAAIAAIVDGYPGIAGSVESYLTETVRDVLTAEGKAIAVRIYGPELAEIRRQAEKVRDALASINGIVDPRVESLVEEPQVEVRVDLARAGAVRLKPGDIRRTVGTIVAGLEVGYLFEQQKVFDVVVWGTPETRHSLTSIGDLLIDTPGDGHVRLSDVAEIRIVPALNVMKREGVSRLIDVVASVEGRNRAAVVSEVRNRLGALEFPLEYHPTILDDSAAQATNPNEIAGFALAAAIGIFLLLQACFGSWLLALLGFATMAAALSGGIIALSLAGGTVFLGSLVGFVAALGISARQTILLMSHCRHLALQEGGTLARGLVLRGARERFAPALTSALAVAVAFLPMIVLGMRTGLEIAHPMAVVVVGCLIAATLLNLLIVPTLCAVLGPGAESKSLSSEGLSRA